jgi:nucleotide-binding universal stress UspA family protein
LSLGPSHKGGIRMRELKILVATDGSEDAAAACRFVRALSLPSGSSIHALCVIDTTVFNGYEAYWTVVQQFRGAAEAHVTRALEEAATILAREGVEVTTASCEGHPVKEILRAADEIDADLVVVGSKGHTGLEGFLMGSVARAVVKRSARPVLVARRPNNNVCAALVATDGSDHAHHAVGFAARLPLPAGAERILVHVVRSYHPFPDYLLLDPREHRAAVETVRRKQEEVGAGLLVEAQELLAAQGISAETALRNGDPATQILHLAAEREVDLIVAGARGVSLLEGLWMGSVADRLLKDARCSVLIVP